MTGLGKGECQIIGARVRALVRACETASLATNLTRDAHTRPYASLVLAAFDHDASPLLLLSDLADHTRNLHADGRAALLYAAPPEPGADPLAEPRATFIGHVRNISSDAYETQVRARYLSRHSSARTYAGFRDFHLYSMTVEQVHLVAGFGRVHWIPACDVIYPLANAMIWAKAEAGLLKDLNAASASLIDRLGLQSVRGSGGDVPFGAQPGVRVIGVEPEGLDLRSQGRLIRVDFPSPVADPGGVKAALAAWPGTQGHVD